VYGTALGGVQLNATATGVNGVTLAGAFVYTPAAGTVLNAGNAQALSVTFTPADANYKSASKTVYLNVQPATPKVSITGGPFTYDATPHAATVSVTGVGGVAVAGSSVITYNGSTTVPITAGTYTVNVAFTSGDPNYTNAAGTGSITINKATPAFSDLNEPSIVLGTASVVLTGKISAGALVPTGSVAVTLNGVTQYAAINSTDGTFSSTFTTAGLDVGSYNTTYSYAGDVNFTAVSQPTSSVRVFYSPAGTACLGDAGHSILPPVNPNGGSVFKQGSTIPAKFRVCDVNGASIGTAGVVKSFYLTQIVNGTVSTSVDESVASTTPDASFRWDPTAQQWIFNISTSNLVKSRTYVYTITLKDNTVIQFQYGLR
jgi:hypothetical protein